MGRNLKIRHKLLVITLLLAVPVVTLGYLYVLSADQRIVQTRAELEGLTYILKLRGILERAPEHEAQAVAAALGDEAARARLASLEGRIEADAGAIDDATRQVGETLGVTEEWQAARGIWKAILQKPGTRHQDIVEQHQRLNAALARVVATAGERSGLVTDFELDSHYLARAVVDRVPRITLELSRLRTSAAAATARGEMFAEELVEAAGRARGVRQESTDLRQSLRAVLKRNANLDANLSAPLGTAADMSTQLADNIDSDHLRPIQGGRSAAGLYEAAGDLKYRHFRVYDQAAQSLAATLAGRQARLSDQKYSQLLVALLLLVTALVVVFEVSRGITWQVDALKNTFQEIGAGNYGARATVYSGDELGKAAISLNTMLDNTVNLIQSQADRDRLQDSIKKLLEEVSGVAEGDLRSEAEVTADVTGAIADSFNYMIAELRTIISRVQKTTTEVTYSALETQRTTEALAAASEKQSEEILAASAAIDHMAASIQQVSQAASRTAGVATQALQCAREGTGSVNRTIEGMRGIRVRVQETSKRMKRLGESSQEIGEIVQMISDLADRTSMLALNASIQAARAGEAGRGFAVVADEVERLAERSTEATRKISHLIRSVQGDTAEAIAAMEQTTREVVEGSQVANEAGVRLAEIESVSAQITELVRGISEFAEAQAARSSSVSRNVTGISTVTQQTAEGARAAAESIRDLSELARALNDSMRHFQLPEEKRPLAA
jgi:methyl-accepting chemotaxis protein